ncbi:MAG: hypothetical protein GC152_02400 [Alphaproteobacteria bacterium]|nr:hypothetical protein [Alphaproteobacteria bacterium]
MTFRFVSMLVVAALAGPMASAADGSLEAKAVAGLMAGGKVIVLRHANSPAGQAGAVGMTAGCRLADGRGLDAIGFAQARAMGAYLAEAGIRISAVYTSEMCRAWDTARLASSGGEAAAVEALVSTDAAIVDAFKTQLEAEIVEDCLDGVCGNILLASHSNVVPQFGAIPAEGEPETPSGALYVVDPATWTALGRVDFMVQTGDDPMSARH